MAKLQQAICRFQVISHTCNDVSVLKSNSRVNRKLSIDVFPVSLLVTSHTSAYQFNVFVSNFLRIFVWKAPWRLFGFIFMNFRFLSPGEFVFASVGLTESKVEQEIVF